MAAEWRLNKVVGVSIVADVYLDCDQLPNYYSFAAQGAFLYTWRASRSAHVSYTSPTLVIIRDQRLDPGYVTIHQPEVSY